MTDLTITSVGDTWANSSRTGQNYGSAKWLQVQTGARYMYVRPHLGSIAGRTVVDAYLTGRSGGTSAQTLTVTPVTERWAPGQLTWANRPAVNTVPAVAVAIPALADGETFDLTGLAALVQAVADGTDYYGFRITSGAATAQKFYSADSGEPAWELHVELSDAPEQPTDLRPDGGAVSVASPILAWEFLDLGGESSQQAASRVQIDKPLVGVDPDEVSPDHDSGWVANPDPQFDPAYSVTGTGPHFWRVQVRDADSNESEWSDWAEFTYTAAPTIVMDSPTGPFGDPTPTIVAHLSSGTVTKWQAMVTGPDRSDVRARTGLVVGSTIEWTLPLREERLVSFIVGSGMANETPGRLVLDGAGPWWLNLRVWDGVERAVGVGEAPYVETWVQLEFDDDLGVQPPTGLLVTTLAADDPRCEWSWERTEEPDAWVVTINGAVVDRLTSDDVTLAAGRYVWRDAGHVAPLRPQVLAVHAVEGNDRSVPVFVSTTPDVLAGVWLIPDADIDPIVLRGDGIDDWTRSDYRATYTTSVGAEVDVTYGQPGRVGSFAGTVDVRDDVWDVLARVEALRLSRNRLARLVWGSHSIPVRVRDIDATASNQILPTNLEHVVRFGFVELDT